MKRKMIALLSALVLVFCVSGAALAATLYIDPINNITLNPVQLAGMQLNGLVIPVTGYAQYLSDTGSGYPKLTGLLVQGAMLIGTNWIVQETLIDWASTQLSSTSIRDSKMGREFTDTAFSEGTFFWNSFPAQKKGKTGERVCLVLASFSLDFPSMISMDSMIAL